MSILKKPYTISVWDDVWNAATGKFEEQRIGIIGADNMLYQGRAIEPNLVRNVNGTKKFSFKMYKYFIDNETGERVENPFVDWLISERKVKLQYKGKWYDFIVKNINENSANYLYTYQLEDALVQELSKNGFGVTLDTKLMNNMGTAGQLATYVLSETDWGVNSEALVEKVEDNLVYVTIPAGTVVHKIIDQTDLGSGIDDSTTITLNENETWGVLAFYTSCTSKPHRFQFIYIPEGYYKEDSDGKHTPSVSTDENQIINVKDCQYYCEINTPEAEGMYVQCNTFKQFYLPKGFNIVDFGEDGISNNHDTTISVWYRGHRYGFAQSAKYIPLLDRYCNEYTKGTTKYYGFVDNDYNSPTLLQNVITNTDFKGTTGWVGTYSGNTPNAKGTYGATIEPVYGEFDDSNKFSSVVDQLSNGTYNSQTTYKSYLKTTFPPTKNKIQYSISGGEYQEATVSNSGVLVIQGESVDENNYISIRFKEDTQLDGTFEYVLYDHEVDLSEIETMWVPLDTLVLEFREGINVYLYLRHTIQSVLINTGFYDNRTSIGEVDYDEEWYFEPTILDSEGEEIENPYKVFDFKLREVAFDTQSGAYNLGKIWAEIAKDGNDKIIPDRLKFNPAPLKDENGNIIKSDTHADVKVSEKDFKNKEIKLVITPINKGSQTYYIEDMQLFKLVRNDNADIIKPGDLGIEGVIKTTYRFFPASEVEVEEDNGDIKQTPIDVKAINYENFDKTEINYSIYVPQYNEGAQKVRSVDAKESNYFNILQSIAEKFEAWLELEIRRNDQGGIISKTAKFKNYAGKDNYASFRYGINLKDIQRTYESKNIVTKLIVKQNSNEYAENGFCTIARAGANQTGENYIYDFRYYHDRDMLDKAEYVAGLYYSENIYHKGLKEAGPDIEGAPCADPSKHDQKGHNCYNLQNYFNRVKNLNVKIQGINDIIIPKQNELIKLKAEKTVQEGLRDAAKEGLEEIREDFQALTGATPENIPSTVDTKTSNIQSMLNEYATYMAQYNDANKKIEGYTKDDGSIIKGLAEEVDQKEREIKNKQEEIKVLTEHKKELNKLFYSRYSRFIQEGTWIDEKYIDDNKYYADAQSVMYNSCYPQVAYIINVIALGALPGYEYFDFELGDRTYAVDPEFFGENRQEAVIINELSENLDDPSKDQIKVQNFKNQFQDLFQKITATVQQTQYSSGSYEKAVALAEASAAIKSEFLQDALNDANSRLTAAGQTTVTQGVDGITLTDSATKDQMRLIGGAILMSVEDENGQRKWKTGLTPEGISASLVTAGTVDTGKIQIKNGKDVTFLWNSFGISAFDVDWNNGEVVGTPDTSKFVRFDKHGIYGMDISNNDMKDGMSWKPAESANINELATFALTWEGLKVTGNEGTIAQFGKQGYNNDDYIMIVKNSNGDPTFTIKNDGSVAIAGNLQIGDAITATNDSNIMGTANRDGTYKWLFDKDNGLKMWCGDNENNPCFSITNNQLTMNGTIKAGSGGFGNPDSFWIVPEGKENQTLFGHTDDWVMAAGDKTGITKDGSIYCSNLIATDGKIGEVEIRKIMPTNANTNNFSWSFDSKKGMFMWNGKQGSGNLTDANLVLGIANTGTASTPNYTLAMKGHVVAESGQIGFLNINKEEQMLEYNDNNGNTLWKISQTDAVFPSKVSVSRGVSDSGGYTVISKVISKPSNATWTTGSMPGLFCADNGNNFSGFSSRYIYQHSSGASREAEIADIINVTNRFKSETIASGYEGLTTANSSGNEITVDTGLSFISSFVATPVAGTIDGNDWAYQYGMVIKKISNGKVTVVYNGWGGNTVKGFYWFAVQ